MTDLTRHLCSLLGTAHPIIQAPMAGGTTTPELVAAVSEAGGLGSLGAAYMTPEKIREAIAAIRQRTTKPFAVNLFAGGYADPTSAAAVAPAMMEVLARHYRALGLPAPKPPEAMPPNPFEAQLEVVLETRPALFSFTFGMPGPAAMERLKQRGIRLAGTATTVEEARLLVAAGVDAVVAQGSEAGAHRGTFAAPSFEAALIGTAALVPQVADAVGREVPVIASGGIMDGRGILAARVLGAAGVQMGTAFLTTDEAGVPEAYKAALIGAHEDATAITRAYSGRPARGIRNAFMLEVDGGAAAGAIPPFPLQNDLTRPMRNAAAKAEDAERLSLWAGQGVRMARRLPAGELVRRLVVEHDALWRSFAAAAPPAATV